ncbi:hypothetical protein Molly5_157 [Maribacter phage Molly_5]|uniref:Uncharacterized protein n=1 Tax=Maribacter phage Molly_1 TaxID=2745685 RepID=A0A8E4XY37_9CAUD|nr:hypothetical protein M1M29_gp157 [Maribacter phage Molly_1]QQO97652.1 hypothetical protein Molly2_157 [Maribacter phage Molly_2]QQO97852.1 hypothetical protein Molly3_157 [Maribacter phage Molly_3]QQO98052.1 hypothetical protein Molly4_157 [Maribacter phage Molly_4]QQO98252.1 hypothetical protein Molly5_157 [Maribacter phage Molly_5]QQO97452.1 hypothetical protein Molly1_157 [Maribacter phage Molly_1]
MNRNDIVIRKGKHYLNAFGVKVNGEIILCYRPMDIKSGDKLVHISAGIASVQEVKEVRVDHILTTEDRVGWLQNCYPIIASNDPSLSSNKISEKSIEKYYKNGLPLKVLVKLEETRDELATLDWFTNFTYGPTSMVGEVFYHKEKGFCTITGIDHPGGDSYLLTDKGKVVWDYQHNKTVFVGPPAFGIPKLVKFISEEIGTNYHERYTLTRKQLEAFAGRIATVARQDNSNYLELLPKLYKEIDKLK